MNEQAIVSKRTKYSYTMSGMGRDMMYALYSIFLIVFLTDAIGLPDWELIMVGAIIAGARIFDAFNDPLMGVIIDNTKTRFGKFKPWILLGAITSSILIASLFQNYNLLGVSFVVFFGILYILSGLTYTMNDIAYWSMYPSFTTDSKEREKIGSLARIFASLGMFLTIALVPIIYQNYSGGPIKAFSMIAIVMALIFLVSQIIVIIGVKEKKSVITNVQQEKTKVKDLLKIIFKNDQLVVIVVAIFLFNTGYFITAALGIYFFNYDFNRFGGFEFTMFSAILAISQLSALALFPILTKKFTRKKIFKIAIIMMVTGYAIFMSVGFILPMNMFFIGFAGLVLFSGQGFIQVLVLVMLADTIEYGQWKLGTRNEGIVFAINPFVTKLATSVQTIVVSVTLVVSGLNTKVIRPVTQARRETPDMSTEDIRALIANNVTNEMLLGLRISMLIIPLVLIIIAYFIYKTKFRIDDSFYKKITDDLTTRMENKNNIT